MTWSILRQHWKKIAGVAVAVVALPATIFGLRFGYEHAEYTVTASYDGFEIRTYGPRLVAEVTVEGTPEEATSEGFRILAGYIFGANVAAEEIAMTTPVERTPADRTSARIAMTTPVDRRGAGDSWVVTFTMPSKYDLATLPKPEDERIVIRELPPQRFAAIRISGSPSESDVAARTEQLAADAAAQGLRVDESAPPIYSRYDPPWTPSLLRRNEIMLRLAPAISDVPAA